MAYVPKCEVKSCISKRAWWWDRCLDQYWCDGHLPGFALARNPERYLLLVG